MQSLVAIGFGVRKPIAETGGVRFINFGQCGVNAEAFVLFVLSISGHKHNAYGQNVENLFKGNVLLLHFAPYGVGTLDACLYGVFHAHLVKLFAYGGCELGYDVIALNMALIEFLQYGGIVLGMLVFKTEVLEFCFNFVESQAVGYRGKDVEGFACNFVLL